MRMLPAADVATAVALRSLPVDAVGAFGDAGHHVGELVPHVWQPLPAAVVGAKAVAGVVAAIIALPGSGLVEDDFPGHQRVEFQRGAVEPVDKVLVEERFQSRPDLDRGHALGNCVQGSRRHDRCSHSCREQSAAGVISHVHHLQIRRSHQSFD